MSETLNKLSNGGKGLPCCGLASLAAVTRTPLPIMYLHYRARYNKPKQWRGSTHFHHTRAMLDLYLVDYDYIERPAKTLENYLKEKPNSYALIRTTKHIQTCLGSAVFDQNGTRDISEYWGKGKYVLDVIKIKGIKLDNLDYRCLLLVTDGACDTMEEARKLYKRYE